MNGVALALRPTFPNLQKRWPSWLVQRDGGVFSCPTVAGSVIHAMVLGFARALCWPRAARGCR